MDLVPRAPSTVGLHVQDLFMKIFFFWLQDGRRMATAAKCPVGIDFDPGLRGVLATMVGGAHQGRFLSKPCKNGRQHRDRGANRKK